MSPTENRQITVVIADDHPLVLRAGASLLEEQGISVLAVARDGIEALQRIKALRPDVALLDVRMPKMDGLEVARRCQEESPSTRIILYTAYPDQAKLQDAFDVGVCGFMNKEAPAEDVPRAVAAVAAGQKYIDPLLAGVIAAPQHSQQGEVHLTQRERQVIGRLSEGMTNEEIGEILFISPETVRTHMRHVITKLGCAHRSEAVGVAIGKGLISIPTKGSRVGVTKPGAPTAKKPAAVASQH